MQSQVKNNYGYYILVLLAARVLKEEALGSFPHFRGFHGFRGLVCTFARGFLGPNTVEVLYMFCPI